MYPIIFAVQNEKSVHNKVDISAVHGEQCGRTMYHGVDRDMTNVKVPSHQRLHLMK